ncbi:hypothetical protein B0F90DRAFT_1822066 [Multifurca ochricompacta]|uniref:Shieldin complex subunit 2 first OB fold domain-containing protein n=1 Tax=Multifurca ochricompacta TaxID=376703 RepID=A0AAD4LWZ4_9AGAM|nr:hypothetical protein B0F90DRAFT_1822066 [Multifurca ochricompacta]
MYDNIIFGGEEEDEGDSQLVDMRTGDQTTLITWAATTQPEDGESSEFTNRRPSLRDFSISRTRTLQQEKDHPHLETQDQSTSTTTNTTGNSYSYSDTSSIARFPDFQFSLGALSALSLALGSVRGPPWGRGNKKVCCFLLAVLEVDGPDEVTVRRGPDTGHVVSVLRLIVGDETSTICKLTAWRQVAETWGGGIRRGDVVYFENILATATEENGSSGGGSTSHAPTFTLVASPYLHSQAEICYRTMPRTSVPADMRLRPDLRLGASDATVRRVAAVVPGLSEWPGSGRRKPVAIDPSVGG